MADEDVWDSWEDMEDSGELDKRLELEKKAQEDKSSSSSSGSNIGMIFSEDSHRTAYQPQLRILKRQTGSGDQSVGNNQDGNPKNKSKTLAEREAAYAEARLRILGSATSENQEEVKSIEEPSAPVLMKKSPTKAPDSPR